MNSKFLLNVLPLLTTSNSYSTSQSKQVCETCNKMFCDATVWASAVHSKHIFHTCFINLFVWVFFIFPMFPVLCPSITLSICLFVYLSILIHLSIQLHIYSSIAIVIRSFLYLYIYLGIISSQIEFGIPAAKRNV